MTEIVGSGIRGGSLGSSHSAENSIHNPIILRNDEPKDPKSETDYSDLDIDLTATNDPGSSRTADKWPASGNSLVSAFVFTSDRVVAGYQDDSNASSPGRGPVKHKTSPLQVNNKTTKGSADYVDLDIIEEVEDEGIKGDIDDDAGTRSMMRSGSSAISCNNPAHESAQSAQPDPAVASLQQLDLINDPLSRRRRKRVAIRNFDRKRPRTPAPTGLSNTASTEDPTQTLYSRLLARNERFTTLTRRWSIIESPTILTMKILMV